MNAAQKMVWLRAEKIAASLTAKAKLPRNFSVKGRRYELHISNFGRIRVTAALIQRRPRRPRQIAAGTVA